jgi:hypothetical protein
VFRRLRETGPGLLVPLAWTFVTAAHVGWVTERTLLIAHVVMVTILVAFVVASWRDMAEGVLAAWRGVMVLGIPLTLLGLVGLLAARGGTVPDGLAAPLSALAVYGWMLLPGGALAHTGDAVPEGALLYRGGAACCLLGAALYAAAAVAGTPTTVAGLALVGVGQTAGILDAVVRY